MKIQFLHMRQFPSTPNSVSHDLNSFISVVTSWPIQTEHCHCFLPLVWNSGP